MGPQHLIHTERAPATKRLPQRLLDNKFESLLVFKKGEAKGYKFHKPRVPQKYITADPRAEKKNVRGRCLGNILRIPAYRPPNIKKMSYHVAAFPEELVAFLLESYTDEGDTVLDPFLGSGTTLKVARVMKRQGIGFEVHAEFADLIRTRIDEEWDISSMDQPRHHPFKFEQHGHHRVPVRRASERSSDRASLYP